MKNKVELIPPDVNQCQAEKPTEVNFMTMGGDLSRTHVRCTAKPTVIITEKVEPHGSMSLCDDCLVVARRQLGDTFTVEKIKKVVVGRRSRGVARRAPRRKRRAS